MFVSLVYIAGDRQSRVPDKHVTLTQSCFKVGPASRMVVQRQSNIGSMSRVCIVGYSLCTELCFFYCPMFVWRWPILKSEWIIPLVPMIVIYASQISLSDNVDSMLVHRRRRWTNIESTLSLVFTAMSWQKLFSITQQEAKQFCPFANQICNW